MYLRKLLFGLILCSSIWTGTLSGQEHYVDGVWGNALQPGAVIDIEDPNYWCTRNNTCLYPFDLVNTKLYAKLSFDDALRRYYGSEWQVKVDYEIELYHYQTTTTPSPVRGSLQIDYHPTDNYQDIDLYVHTPSPAARPWTRAVLRVINVYITDRSAGSIPNPFGSSPQDIANDIFLELHLEVDRVYKLDVNQVPDIVNTGNYDPATQELRVHWNHVSGAVEYDLEWLFVDMAHKNQGDLIQVDFRNATRITTQQNFYRISLAYPRGYLLYRVRAIGKALNPTTNLFDRRLEGRWSFQDGGTYRGNGNQLRPDPPLSNPFGLYNGFCNDFYFWSGLEPDKNWQYTATYAEDGKRKEVINFYDGILKSQQTVTVLNTDETAVVAEPVYDYLGRNSLQVLPAPQRSQGIRYYSPLHYNSSGQVYNYEDFDFNTHIDKPQALSSQWNLGAGYYYSDQNTSPLGINGQYTPDAEGYPFSRTIYKNDGSGRVKAVSGVGKEYFSGANKSMLHETQFYYSSPFQEELFLLFANEVGHAKYYEKTVVVDANGQASTSIKDLSGRVIATALAGDAPDNLYEIDTKPATYRQFTVNLNPLNELDGEALTVNKTFTVIGNTRYNFRYQLDPSIFDDCGVRTPCVYNLLIYLEDEYGNRQTLVWNGDNVDKISRDRLTNRPADRRPIDFSATLTTGSYQLVKILTINESDLDLAVSAWREQQNCFQPRQEEPITTCTPDCKTLCDEAYLTPVNSQGKQYYLATDGSRVAEVVNGAVTTVYDRNKWNIVQDSIRACSARCAAVDLTQPLYSECDLKYELLKQDMSPGGQYFDNLPDQYLDSLRLNPAYDRNGWLDRVATRNPHFAEFVKCVGEGVYGNWDNVRNNWMPEYPDILIKLHPEWCAFQTLCCAESNCPPYDANTGVEPTITYQDSCQVLSADIRAKIQTYLNQIDFNSLSQQAIAQISDPSLHVAFSPQKLRERAEAFYEEYYKYQLVKDKCEGLYLDSPKDDLYTADGFMIRYPENPLFEAFDPDNPTDTNQALQDDICEEQAEQAAEAFVAKVKDQCGTLTPIQEKELKKFVYEEYKRSCQDPALQIDLNESIRDYISCTSQLPDACYVEALPVQSDTSCACSRINDFVYSAMYAVDNTLTFYDVVSNPMRYGNDPAVQDALDLVLTPTETTLKPNFIKWFEACNDPDYYSWMGANPAPPYQLANYFVCDSTQVQPPCDTCCATNLNEYAQAIANLEFERLLRQKAQEYRAALIDTCLKQAYAKEQFSMQYDYKEYHYTLYYYDQAGDLVKTVPPEGLYQKDPEGTGVYHNSLLTDNEIAACYDYLQDDTKPFQHTYHLMVTNYRYNSLQNVLAQKTPDGGISTFYYDALGRLVVSQNAVQKSYARPRYSYLQYDALGRTIEAGELELGVGAAPMDKATAEDITHYNNPAGSNRLLNWYKNNPRRERTLSFYDGANPNVIAPSHPANGLQTHLRNRIATVAYDQDGDSYRPNPASPTEDLSKLDALTHYSYDVLGNVDMLWQENRNPIIPVAHQVKRFDYRYDLVSGNVNEVRYQYGQPDMLLHRYAYDADNRLTKVWTSTNDVIWDQDAQYFYYAHGPLAREEIGDLHVFANDYIYDIRGWITAMNASTVDAQRDAGKDGVAGGLNENFGRDPFAFSLHYFNGHYKPISASANDVLVRSFSAIQQSGSINTADTKPLYNGNISMMVTSMKDVAQQPISAMANAYKYDQLNRIKSFTPFWDQAGNAPLTTNTFDLGIARNEGQFYNSHYFFDGNGNIHRLERNGINQNGLSSEKMDNMSYAYDAATAFRNPTNNRPITTAQAKTNNQLHQVADAINTPGYDADIEQGQSPNNYQYDAIGRLISDDAEEISRIDWNVSNKITEILRPGASTRASLRFGYGPMGNRIYKWAKEWDASTSGWKQPKHTWYVLDAQGNPIALYGLEGSGSGPLPLILEDFILYGSKRLGTQTVDKQLAP
jgi:YD repeat-containing protein